MKTSIIIPVYNVEKYLENCINSVLALNSQIEVLLIDDGSTDQSGKMCDDFALKDQRIRVIHKENGGLSDARNVGIDNSTGDFLLFLDSDDFLNPEETDRLLSQITEQTDVAVGLYREFYEQNSLYKNEDCDAFLKNTGEMSSDSFLQIIPKDGQDCYLTAWRFIVKRKTVSQNRLYFFKGILHEDEEWMPRMLFSAKTIILTDCFFYNYRQARNDSIMGTVKPKRIWDTFTVFEHHRKLLEENGLNLIQKDFLLCRMAALFCNNMINYKVLTGQDKKTALALLKNYHAVCKNHFNGTKGKVIKLLTGLLGIFVTAEILKAVSKLRDSLKG